VFEFNELESFFKNREGCIVLQVQQHFSIRNYKDYHEYHAIKFYSKYQYFYVNK